jgi:hypothetical protein
MDCKLQQSRKFCRMLMSSSYPYPLFEQLDTVQRAGLFTLAASMMTASTALLQWLYTMVNGLEGKEKKSTPNNIKGE